SNGVVPDVTGSVPVSGAGTTSVNSLDLSAFADGPLDLSVVFSDSVGNTAAPGFGTAQKDVIVNAASNIQLNGGTTINASTEASVDLTFETGEAGSATYSISDGVHPALTATIAVAGGPAAISALDVRSL